MIGESEALSDTGNIRRLLMDGGVSARSSDWFHCSCLLWKGHIMDNWWTLFISQCTAVLLCTIFIYCSLCWNTSSLNTKTEWHYLLAVVIRFFFFFIPSFHSFDSTKHPHSTQKYHMHTTSSFSHVQMEALPGLSTIANMALLFFPQQAAIRACSDSTAFDIYISTEF